MNIDEMLKNEVFKDLEQERIDAVKKIVEEVRGKSANEAMMIILKYSKVLNSGRKISKEEKEAMMEVVYGSLGSAEKEQFKGIIKFVEKFT